MQLAEGDEAGGKVALSRALKLAHGELGDHQMVSQVQSYLLEDNKKGVPRGKGGVGGHHRAMRSGSLQMGKAGIEAHSFFFNR